MLWYDPRDVKGDPVSCVTNYIVQAPNEYGQNTWHRDCAVFFQALNDALSEDGHPPAPEFYAFKDEVGRRSYGGSKVLECNIRIWALNYCRPQTFLPLVQAVADKLEWNGFGEIQVFYMDQEDEVFTEWRVGHDLP